MLSNLQFQDILCSLRDNRASDLQIVYEDTIYSRLFRPQERLIIFGGGHVAYALYRIAVTLGFAVCIADDRALYANPSRFPDADRIECGPYTETAARLKITSFDYVVIMTRGHQHDAECLRSILQGAFPRYLGWMGSRRRTAAFREQLQSEGFPPDLLARIHTPIGLPIHAETPEEIAISVAAELISVRRSEPDLPSAGDRLLLDDSSLPVVRFLAEDPNPKAVLIVIETDGSSPVHSGAIMAIDCLANTVGTIGGGCAEAAACRMAHALIGTGKTVICATDMMQDITENEGMACGGTMKVLLCDLSMETEETP